MTMRFAAFLSGRARDLRREAPGFAIVAYSRLDRETDILRSSQFSDCQFVPEIRFPVLGESPFSILLIINGFQETGRDFQHDKFALQQERSSGRRAEDISAAERGRCPFVFRPPARWTR